MNVYDFDGTIYDGDSTIDFYFYCIRRHPNILRCLPKQLMGALRYKLNKINKTEFKEQFYCFLTKLREVDRDVEKFWDCHENRIKSWYIETRTTDDVVISASPEFLLREICNRIQIEHLIASKVDKENGKYEGTNCYGQEKVRRFFEVFPDGKIELFYSDSYSDDALARMANKAYIVKKDKRIDW